MSAGSGATGMQYQGASFIPTSSSLRRYARFGPFHLDIEQQELFRNGSRVRVQGKVCDALLILINRAGEVVTRETLRERGAHLWGCFAEDEFARARRDLIRVQGFAAAVVENDRCP